MSKRNIVSLTFLAVVAVLLVACAVASEPITVTREAVVEKTAVFIPTATPTSAPVTATALPTVVPTPLPTVVVGETAVSPCPRPNNLAESKVDVVGTNFCLVWIDDFNNETSFDILLTYPRSGEQFSYTVAANITEFVVPDEAAPHLDASLQACNQRKDFAVTVTAVRANGQQKVGGMAAIIECPALFAPPAPDNETRRLQDSLVWQELSPNLHQLAGWAEGYRRSRGCDSGPYRWLDDTHLMLLPIVGYTSWYEDPQGGEVTQPVILDVATRMVWASNQTRTDGCQLPVYLPERQLLAESNGTTVWLRQLDGFIQQSYAGGNPLHLGDTGLRLLAGNVWLDLVTDARVVLPIDEPMLLRKVAWTKDDTRFYACCVFFGDVVAGTFYQTYTIGDIFPAGVDIGLDYSGEWTEWFSEGTYVVHEAGAVYWANVHGEDVVAPDRPPVTPTLPLIDPVNQTYLNLGAALGLTQTVECYWESAKRPFFDQIWLQDCSEAGLLVAVPELTTQTVPGSLRQWSPNGRYALVVTAGSYALFDPAAMTLIPLDVPSTATHPTWSPDEAYLAFAGEEGMGVYWAETAVGHSRHLPTLRTNGQLAWQPHADTLAVALDNGTITFVSSSTDNSQQTLPAYDDIRDLRWSPDGTYLSWVAGSDVIVFAPLAN